MDINPPTPPENQSTGQPGQPGAGGAPPQQPYQPAPPQYQQQQYAQPGGHPQAPPPAPQQKRGFNWLACCGISCLVVLILFGGMAFCTYRMALPMYKMGTELQAIASEVGTTDPATIRTQATAVDETTLAANPEQYSGQWLELEGELASTSFSGSSTLSFGDFSTENFTNYMLAQNITVNDVTAKPAVGGAGDRIRAYGKCFTFDFEDIPVFGKFVVESMQSDPAFQDATKMIFFICRDIELVDAAGNTGSAMETTGGEDAGEDTGADGWVR